MEQLALLGKDYLKNQVWMGRWLSKLLLPSLLVPWNSFSEERDGVIICVMGEPNHTEAAGQAELAPVLCSPCPS